MSVQVFRFDSPDRFVVGTVGDPGDRTFFLQARDSHRLTSVVLEKEQVSVLAERVDIMLDEIVRRTGGVSSVPASAPADDEDLEPLEQPIIEEFRVDSMTLSWDGDNERVVVAAYAPGDGPGDSLDDDSDDDAADPEADDDAVQPPSLTNPDRDALIVRLTGAEARAFARRAQAVVSAGRPPCPLCGLPLSADGHICPRQNGYRRSDDG